MTRGNFTGAHQKTKKHSAAIAIIQKNQILDQERAQSHAQLFSSVPVSLQNVSADRRPDTYPKSLLTTSPLFPEYDINGLGPGDMQISSEEIELFFPGRDFSSQAEEENILVEEFAALRMAALEEEYLDSANDATIPTVIEQFQSIGL